MSVDVEEALAAKSKEIADVRAIAGERLFPQRIPARSEIPAAIFRRTGGGPVPKVDGTISAVRRCTFSVDAYGTSQLEARNLCRALQQVHGFRGQSGDWWIQHMLVVQGSETDNGIVPIFGDDAGAFSSSFELDVAYNPVGI